MNCHQRVLSSVALLTSLVGCGRDGPFYITSAAPCFSAGARPAVLVRRLYEKDSILPGYRALDGSTLFAIPAAIRNGTITPAGEALKVSDCECIAIDPVGDPRPPYRSIAGTNGDWLRIEPTPPSLLFGTPTLDATVVHAAGGANTPLARFEFSPGETLIDGYAATRDGRHLLVIRDHGVTRWETTTGVAHDEPGWDVLCGIKNAQEHAKNYPGYWFLTDDLMYVVNIPQVGSNDGHGGYSEAFPDSWPLRAGPVSFDAGTDGVAYETATGKLSTFKLYLPADADGLYKLRATDVESVNGQLQVLYSLYKPPARGCRYEIVRTDGAVIARVEEDAFAYGDGVLTAWDPARHTCVFGSNQPTAIGPKQAGRLPSNAAPSGPGRAPDKGGSDGTAITTEVSAWDYSLVPDLSGASRSSAVRTLTVDGRAFRTAICR